VSIDDEAEPTAAGSTGAGGPSGAREATAGLTMFELARLEEARRRAAEVEAQVRASASVTAHARRPRNWLSAVAFMSALGVVLAIFRSSGPDVATLDEIAAVRVAGAGAEVARDAATEAAVAAARPGYGRSGDVLVRVAMPNQMIESPVALPAGSSAVRYQWVRAADSSEADAPRLLAPGTAMLAPPRPGLYHLAVGEGASRRVLDDLSLAVLVPFAQKFGGTVNGYRLGSWPFERLGGERPLGFVEVTARTARVPVSRHLRLGDFVSHDRQSQWPRYVVVSPRLLDKVELVVDEIAKLRGVPDPSRIRVRVNSGFRTPLHNSGVEGSALNSRHQYGDAADVAIDADGDGRFTSFDSRIVGLAVEMIEKRHPELVGGLGVYVNARSSYVHIDARGRRARWWG
jgi:uncharacterized protein YcbK (DUF882 family)